MPRFFSAPPKPASSWPLKWLREIGVHDGLADLGLLHKGKVDGNEGLVGALDAVGDDDVRAGLQRREAVEVGGVHMIEGVLPAADVEGVAVGEEGFAAELADIVHHDLRILRAQVGKVAELAEVDLDGGVFVREIDVLKTGGLHEPVQFLRESLVRRGVEIGEPYF